MFCLGHLNIVKMQLLPKLIYKFNAILIKTPVLTSSLLKVGKLILNIIGENKHIGIIRKVLRRKKHERRLTLHIIRAHSKASMINGMVPAHEHVEQQTRIENS